MSNLLLEELILASGSSRRHQLLSRLNLRYGVQIPNIDESLMENEHPAKYVARMAQTKARTVYESLENKQAVLAADTIISLHENVIGKPENSQHAESILQELSSKEHEVITGVCFIDTRNYYQSIALTKVKFKQLTDEEIYTYCLTEEPYDKAGAYAIQGQAARFVEYISGSYTNVVGLPLLEVSELLKQANL